MAGCSSTNPVEDARVADFRLDRFSMEEAVAIAGPVTGPKFKRRMDKMMGKIEEAFNSLQDAVDAIEAAQAAADAANVAAATANTAATTAAAAATSAQSAADSANDTIDEIEAGTLDLSAVKVGGTRFVNTGGSLVPE